MIKRRTFMKAVAGVSATSVVSAAKAQRRPSHTFVLVHGAWHGGWCWRDVAGELRARAQKVTTPPLTGLGERAHLLSASVDLETHINDVLNHIDAEEAEDIVLVGHSYGGFVVRGACARRASRIAHIVYLDAFVPGEGETVSAYASPERARLLTDVLAKDPAGTMPPLKPAAFGISDPAQADWVARRLTPHPVRTYLQPLSLGPGAPTPKSRHYIACMSPKLDVFEMTRDRIRRDNGFTFAELDAGHDVMVTAPSLLTEKLLAIAG